MNLEGRAAPAPGVTVLVVQHAADCPPALLGEWLEAAGCVLEVCRPDVGEDLPRDLTAYDGLVVLGGPMGAHDDEAHPWLVPTRVLVRSAVEAGVPTLGVCLGHQLAAVALGGTVSRGPLGQQVGLVPVGWTAAAADDELLGPLVARGAPPDRGVHWNRDVVSTLPAGAVLLARTDRDEIQAARLAPRCWGLQWHPEVDESVLAPWAADDRGSHEAHGIDQAAVLREVAAARAELDASGRALAGSFTEIVRRRAAAR